MAGVHDSKKLTSGFAKRLRAARHAFGCTQEVFSRHIGIKRDRYAKYELGQAEPPFYILTKVSELTHQSLDSLIGGKVVVGREALETVGSQISDLQAVVGIQASWWWKTDKEHRVVEVWHLHNAIPQGSGHTRSLNRTRWENAGGDPEMDEVWKSHREEIEAHRVFENFRYELVDRDGQPKYVCVSGKPVFDEHGNFQGYAGYGYSSKGVALKEVL